jgi:hypothetical protein
MSALNLDAIKARAEAATSPPWGAGNKAIDGLLPWELVISKTYPMVELDSSEQGGRDAEFIAHARQDVPDLLSEVGRLREANANLIRNAEILADEIVSGTRPVVSW